MTLNVSPITLGTSGLGRDTVPGSPGEEAAVAFARELFAGPHAFVDTSNNYAGGRSEAVLGLAIAQVDAAAADPLEPGAGTRVISKVDCEPGTGVFDRERVLRSFDETTARLGVDRLPLLHLHDPYTVTFDEAMGRGGAVEGLIELRESGRVDGIGVAAGPVPLMARYVATDVFDAVLVHNRFTLVDQSAAVVFADARERGMTVFNAAPFGAGILATGAREGAVYGYRPASAELQEWVSRAEGVCASFGVALPAVALHYSLRSPLVDSTVVGVSSTRRLAQLDELLATTIPDEVWAEIEALGPAPSPVDDSDYA
ncbi:aldo/keto reductase [Microbacterium timonense]|uniref:aldo/keto reductase n=1 Tax=Microbacterium timonense TaxID=2086576 RepID=UPI000D109581|nr:aldo/keto reductase [Microbacterium timonense]